MHRAWLLAVVLAVACSDDGAGPAPAGSGAGAGGAAAVGGSGGSPDAGGAGGSGGTGGSDGGAGTGGSAGLDAGAGVGGGTAGSPSQINECEDDADCKVVGDCCSCAALPTGAGAPAMCDATCAEDRCAQLGVSAVCAMGRCVFDASCNDSEVTCRSAPPDCAPGQQATVQGTCWGGCVDVRDCLAVKSCDACRDDQACVVPGVFGPGTGMSGIQCWDVEPECNGKPTCDCMGNAICEPIQCGDNSERPDDPIDIGCFCISC